MDKLNVDSHTHWEIVTITHIINWQAISWPQLQKLSPFKEIVYSKMNILNIFTHSRVLPVQYAVVFWCRTQKENFLTILAWIFCNKYFVPFRVWQIHGKALHEDSLNDLCSTWTKWWQYYLREIFYKVCGIFLILLVTIQIHGVNKKLFSDLPLVTLMQLFRSDQPQFTPEHTVFVHVCLCVCMCTSTSSTY